jgi:hypothetical protein
MGPHRSHRRDGENNIPWDTGYRVDPLNEIREREEKIERLSHLHMLMSSVLNSSQVVLYPLLDAFQHCNVPCVCCAATALRLTGGRKEKILSLAGGDLPCSLSLSPACSAPLQDPSRFSPDPPFPLHNIRPMHLPSLSPAGDREKTMRSGSHRAIDTSEREKAEIGRTASLHKVRWDRTTRNPHQRRPGVCFCPGMLLCLLCKLLRLRAKKFTRRGTWCRWRWPRRRRHGQPCRGRWRA